MKTALVRQRGFTLIELLVVVAIIVLLASLSAGTFFRIYASQKVSAMNATGTKLNTALDRKWSAILDTAAEDAKNGRIHPEVVRLAGGDLDRARTIWTYFKLKNGLPTTYAEALGELNPNPSLPAPGRGIWVWSPQNAATQAVLVMKPLGIFSQLPLTTTASQEEQSAVCLYWALTASADRGNITDSDGLGPQTADVVLGGASRRVFVDQWDTPIAFSRMSFAPELNTPDYSRLTPGAISRDPCDPTGRLLGTGGWDATKLNDFWVRATADHIAAGVPATYPATLATTQNWVTTVISAGPNKQWDGLFAPDSDNIVSYRLRREGNRGD